MHLYFYGVFCLIFCCHRVFMVHHITIYIKYILIQIPCIRDNNNQYVLISVYQKPHAET